MVIITQQCCCGVGVLGLHWGGGGGSGVQPKSQDNDQNQRCVRNENIMFRADHRHDSMDKNLLWFMRGNEVIVKQWKNDVFSIMLA